MGGPARWRTAGSGGAGGGASVGLRVAAGGGADGRRLRRRCRRECRAVARRLSPRAGRRHRSGLSAGGAAAELSRHRQPVAALRHRHRRRRRRPGDAVRGRRRRAVLLAQFRRPGLLLGAPARAAGRPRRLDHHSLCRPHPRRRLDRLGRREPHRRVLARPRDRAAGGGRRLPGQFDGGDGARRRRAGCLGAAPGLGAEDPRPDRPGPNWSTTRPRTSMCAPATWFS